MMINVKEIPTFFKRAAPPKPPSRRDTWHHVTSAMDATDIYQAFYQTIFHNTNRAFITDLTSKTRFQSFEAKETILRQGDFGNTFYIVKDGEVTVTVNDADSGKQIIVATLGKHEYFGELALLCPNNPLRQATIVAVVPTTVIQIMKDDFLKLLEKHPKFEAMLRERMEAIR